MSNSGSCLKFLHGPPQLVPEVSQTATGVFLWVWVGQFCRLCSRSWTPVPHGQVFTYSHTIQYYNTLIIHKGQLHYDGFMKLETTKKSQLKTVCIHRQECGTSYVKKKLNLNIWTMQSIIHLMTSQVLHQREILHVVIYDNQLHVCVTLYTFGIRGTALSFFAIPSKQIPVSCCKQHTFITGQTDLRSSSGLSPWTSTLHPLYPTLATGIEHHNLHHHSFADDT